MMRRALACILLFALLAGCALPARSPAGPAPACFLGSAQIAWNDPALYDALLAVPEADGVNAVDPDQEAPPWRVEHDALARWRDPRVAMVTLSFNDPWVRVIPWTPGEARIEMPYHENETAIARLRALLDALSLGEHPERLAWERALLASRGQGAYLVTIVTATPRLEALLDELQARGAPEVLDERLAGASLRWGEWRVDVRLGAVTLTTVDPRYTVTVDETGRALANTELTSNEDPRAVMEERTRDFFARIMLPPPSVQNVRGGAGAC